MNSHLANSAGHKEAGKKIENVSKAKIDYTPEYKQADVLDFLQELGGIGEESKALKTTVQVKIEDNADAKKVTGKSKSNSHRDQNDASKPLHTKANDKEKSSLHKENISSTSKVHEIKAKGTCNTIKENNEKPLKEENVFQTVKFTKIEKKPNRVSLFLYISLESIQIIKCINSKRKFAIPKSSVESPRS